MSADWLTDGPAQAGITVVLAHGAGAPMDSDFMAYFAGVIANGGRRAIRFEFPYMQRRRSTGRCRCAASCPPAGSRIAPFVPALSNPDIAPWLPRPIESGRSGPMMRHGLPEPPRGGHEVLAEGLHTRHTSSFEPGRTIVPSSTM